MEWMNESQNYFQNMISNLKIDFECVWKPSSALSSLILSSFSHLLVVLVSLAPKGSHCIPCYNTTKGYLLAMTKVGDLAQFERL